jgi:hypothetical protein
MHGREKKKKASFSYVKHISNLAQTNIFAPNISVSRDVN